MAGPNYRELSNLIREKCRIKVTNTNKDKFVFSKEEQLVILSHITQQEEIIKRRELDTIFINEVVSETLRQLKDGGYIHAG
jgi:hypothetical protein